MELLKTLSLLDATVLKREVAPLLKIPDNYEKTILTMDKTYLTDYRGIRFQHILDFLMESYES